MCKEAGIDKDNRRKFTLNEKFFSEIDSPIKAYWLGFLAADGSISEDRGRIDLQLQLQDKKHIQKFLDAIGSSKDIKERKTNNNQFDCIYVHLNSTKMVEDLVKLGIHQNKSLDLLFPNDTQVPYDLKIYWILGYYDGDGSISSWKDNNLVRFKTSFTGTEEVLTGINNFFNYNNTLRQEHNCLDNTKNLTYTEGKSKEWLSKAYNDKSIQFCLERKYNKYIEILNARGEK